MQTSDPGPHGDLDTSMLSLLVDSVVDYAIFVLDPDGVVRSWNPGARRVKGYAPDEIIGSHFSVFYTPEDRDAGLPARLLAQAAADGRVTHRGWRVRKDGSRFHGDVTITALRDAAGTLRGFAKVTRDRTDQHEAEVAMAQALDREREAAQELSRLAEARARFMAAIGHDLRTPLSVIRGSLPFLDGDDEDRAASMDVIRRNVDRLVMMTHQLTELARLERGERELDPRPVELRPAVADAVASLGPLLDAVDVGVDVDGTAHVDELAFERMLVNLLTNAARHAPEGSCVTVATRVEPPFVVVTVEDQGPGVPEEEREVIFDEFRQGQDRARGQGLGLGLSIVRRYARAHGGRAWVEDGANGGARFCLALPASAPVD